MGDHHDVIRNIGSAAVGREAADQPCAAYAPALRYEGAEIFSLLWEVAAWAMV